MKSAGLKAQWKDWSGRFMKLSRRERGLTFAAVLVGAFMGAQSLFLDPLLAQRKLLAKSIPDQQRELTTLEQIVGIQQGAGLQPSPGEQAELDALQATLAKHTARLDEIRAGMVSAKDMPALLETLLARHHRLQLVAMKTLPAEALGEKTDSPTAATGAAPKAVVQPVEAAHDEPKLYRHAVEMTLRGSYADLSAYLAALEAQGTRLLWQRVELDATQHPAIELSLTLYTLSLEKTWLAM